MKGRFFTGGLVAGILFAAATTFAADTNAPARVGRRAFANGLRGGQAGGASGFGLGGPMGVLNEQQRTSYLAALREMRPKFAELESKLRVARQELLDISVGTKFDETVTREKALAVASIEAEMTVLRVKAMAQVQPPLTPEEVEKIKGRQPAAAPLERPTPRKSGLTNGDENGLPPKQ